MGVSGCWSWYSISHFAFSTSHLTFCILHLHGAHALAWKCGMVATIFTVFIGFVGFFCFPDPLPQLICVWSIAGAFFSRICEYGNFCTWCTRRNSYCSLALKIYDLLYFDVDLCMLFFQPKSSEREEACQAGEIVYNLYKGMGRLLSGAREESKREDS